MKLDAHIPPGSLTQKWTNHKHEIRLVSPANKRKYDIIVVGTGLSGASSSATLAELGYNVKSFCVQDSARRAHSVAAQGGINAAKNYRNDWRQHLPVVLRHAQGRRLPRARGERLSHGGGQCERDRPCGGPGGAVCPVNTAGIWRPAPLAARKCRERSTRAARRDSNCCWGRIRALSHQISLGTVKMYPRHEMLELIVVNGHAKGIVVRDLVSGGVSSVMADAVVLATGGYSNVFYLSTSGGASNATALWRAHRKGALFANPCFTQIHPTCIPVSGDYQSKLTLMSESLRNDGRVWVPKKAGEQRAPQDIPEGERDYYLERTYPTYGNLVPRDIASRAAKRVCDEGRGVGPGRLGVFLDFRDAVARLGKEIVEERYGESLRNVSGDHGRRRLQNADADLPGHSLHDGRTVGGLQPDEQPARAVRGGRGELLRPWRKPPGRERIDAGVGRRVFHPALYHRGLSVPQRSEATVIGRGGGEAGGTGDGGSSQQTADDSRQTHARGISQSNWAGFSGTTAAWRAMRPA